jgi:hypothetical protein
MTTVSNKQTYKKIDLSYSLLIAVAIFFMLTKFTKLFLGYERFFDFYAS